MNESKKISRHKDTPNQSYIYQNEKAGRFDKRACLVS